MRCWPKLIARGDRREGTWAALGMVSLEVFSVTDWASPRKMAVWGRSAETAAWDRFFLPGGGSVGVLVLILPLLEQSREGSTLAPFIVCGLWCHLLPRRLWRMFPVILCGSESFRGRGRGRLEVPWGHFALHHPTPPVLGCSPQLGSQ